jgi:hypothetical protein
MFCTKWDRAALFEAAGSQDYRKMVSMARGIRAITRWMISCDESLRISCSMLGDGEAAIDGELTLSGNRPKCY